MIYKFPITSLLLAALLVSSGNAFGQKSSGTGTGRGQGVGRGEGKGRGAGHDEADEAPEEPAVATTAVTSSVNVTLATRAGKISVRGWDRNELRAQSKEAGATIELRKSGDPNEASPSSRVEIMVSGKPDNEARDEADCYADADVTLDVPRGATIILKTEDGDIDVEGVGEAHIDTTGGRIDLRGVSKATEARSVGGDVSLEDSSGRAQLGSIGGVVGIRGLRALDPSDSLKITTVSGDILLDRVGLARVEANTISGVIKMVGPLARGGTYAFTSTIGDITLVLAADASFKLVSKVSEGGEIITDFPLKYKGSASPFTRLHAGRLVGDYGSGDATINLISFSGTVRLRKK
jgi:hypothetical protein